MVRISACVALGGIGLYLGSLYARMLSPQAAVSMRVASPSTPAVPSQIRSPDPSLSPADVVRLQMAALRAFRDDKAAIHQCFVLASPANRAVTGPLDRFIAMVQNATYRALVMQTGALVGRPVIRGEQATVLVTVVDENQAARAYRFFLSKQTDPRYLDCWMTDAVIPMHGQTGPGKDRPPPASAA